MFWSVTLIMCNLTYVDNCLTLNIVSFKTDGNINFLHFTSIIKKTLRKKTLWQIKRFMIGYSAKKTKFHDALYDS